MGGVDSLDGEGGRQGAGEREGRGEGSKDTGRDEERGGVFYTMASGLNVLHYGFQDSVFYTMVSRTWDSVFYTMVSRTQCFTLWLPGLGVLHYGFQDSVFCTVVSRTRCFTV